MIGFATHKKNIKIKHDTNIVPIDNAASYSGDVHILEKYKEKKKGVRKQPLAAAIVGVNNTDAPLPLVSDCFDAWTDIDALELFLNSKPTCYLILGKPGAGAYNLGESISKKYNCIHLCPKNIVDDEMDQKSPTGQCVHFNIRLNKAITFETFIKMLKIKVESSVIQHRGYVISGFPLVTCDRSPQYLINTLHGEESYAAVGDILFETISNLNKKKTKKKHISSGDSHTSLSVEENYVEEDEEDVEEEPEPEEELGEEEEELKVELPKFLLDTCSDVIHPTKAYYNTKKVVLLKQLDELFHLKLNPDIIIYLSCPDKDLIVKKTHKYINYKTLQIVVKPFGSEMKAEVRWPPQYTTNIDTIPIDIRTFNPKYAVRHPMNFEKNSVGQMCNYNNDIEPFLEKKLKDFNPKCVIKTDARLSLHEMLKEISERLLLMAIKPIIIPEPLRMEEPPEEMDEFWTTVKEQNVVRSGAASFNRRASPWLDRCPVELKKRISRKGNPKLAISFLNYVFLTASLDNLIAFYKNPRPYLKLKYLEPTCRIIVIGTKLSGKTMVSQCLHWLFDAQIINYNDILETEIKKKYDVYAKTILSEIIATIEDERLRKWQEAESERYSSLDIWCKTTIASLKKYIPLKEYLLKQQAVLKQKQIDEKKRRQKEKKKEALEKKEKEESKQDQGKEEEQENKTVEEEQAPEIMEEVQLMDPAFMKKFNNSRSKLDFLPFLDNIDECEEAIKSPETVSAYAPKELTKPKEKPTLPMLGDKDVTDAITAYIQANELQKEISPTAEELMSIITSIISSIDIQHQHRTNMNEMYGKYIIDGFPSEIEYWDALAESNFFPDYTIAIVESREIEPELLQHYKVISNCMKNHQERFILSNDPLIKTKLILQAPKKSKVADMKIIVHDFMQNTNFDKVKIPENIEENLETESWQSFSETIEKFKEDWDTIKIKLEEYNKCFIDIQLENKSDVGVIDEIMLKLRKCYYLSCEVSEDEEFEEQNDDNEVPKDIMTYNNSVNFGDTGIYCPISYYDYGVLWEGKPEFSVKFDGKLYRLCKEELIDHFQNDVTKYQHYNYPFKILPPLRICVIGCIGSGKTTVSKLLAKELGLMHIDFSEIVNDLLKPRHFKKVGRQFENTFTDIPMDDEAVVDFQMDEGNEDLISDIMSSETEIRKMIYNYFERGSQILPQLMQKLISVIWFKEPFVNTGFILDGYPKIPSDVEDMVACFCIPDLIIELECGSEKTLERLSSNMLKTWKTQLSEAKDKAKKKLQKEKKDWMEFLTKNIVVKLIYDEILDNMFLSPEHVKGLSVESVLIDANPSGTIIDPNLFNTFNEMIQTFPEPIDYSTWEKSEDALERIEGRIEGIFESDDENIQALKDLLFDQKIKIISIDGNKSLSKVIRLALSKLTYLRNRNESFFEETLIVNPDIAEVLLLEGRCILSNKFKRMCPVYIYDNPNVLQNVYDISKRKGEVFSVIHRSYMYFICGRENLKKFRSNPLKYLKCKNICEFKQYPLRISVIGTPKSGKSTLSAKLAKRYGLICLSRGIALRNMLDNKHWTELGTKIMLVLSAGECISMEYIMKAVQMMVMDQRTTTHGFVFDGFPESASEAIELAKDGLYPNIVFDLSADIVYVEENSQKEIYYDLLKIKPPYSRQLIKHKFKKWQENAYNIRDWIKSDYQNLYKIDGNNSKWKCLEQAVNVLTDFITKVHTYLTKVKTDVVPVDFMCISNEEFEKRMSAFKHMCPLCYRVNKLNHNGNPVVKKGIVQYRDKFYWICPEHTHTVLKNPSHLSSENVENLPELPLIIKRVNMSLVYEKGICMVTYAEHLPSQTLVCGTSQYAASYKENRYLFCSQTCLDKFLAKPHLYYDIKVFRNTMISIPLTLKGLPNIGYLEQTVGILITEACVSATVHRPKYPGLSYQLSALLHIALYLKTHNPTMPEDNLEMYKKASAFFDSRCRLVTHVGLYLRSMDNPFALYPKCCGHIESQLVSLTTSTGSENFTRESFTTET